MEKAKLPLCVMTKCYLAKKTFSFDAMKNTIFGDYGHRPTSSLSPAYWLFCMEIDGD